MAYNPQAGTIPALVIQHLQQHPPGTEIATSVLAEAIGQFGLGLSAFLSTAVKHGAVVGRRIPGKGNGLFWRLGRPEEARSAEQLADDDRPAPAAAPAPPTAAAPASTTTAGLFKPVIKPARRPKAPTTTPAKPKQRGLRVAAWSSGELAIETETDVIVFNAPEAQQVISLVRGLGVGA